MATNNASGQGSTTLTVLERVEGTFTFPTLRLHHRPDPVQTPVNIEGIDTMLKSLEEALKQNSEELRAFLKSLVPKRENSPTEGAYTEALENFGRVMPVLLEMLEDHSSLIVGLLDTVEKYLMEAWNLRSNGASEEEIKKFREDKRKEAADKFGAGNKNLQEQIKKFASGASEEDIKKFREDKRKEAPDQSGAETKDPKKCLGKPETPKHQNTETP